MRWLWLTLCLTALVLPGAGHAQELDVDDLAASAEQWAKDNLDEDALRALASGDQEKVRKYLSELQKELHGEYVLDLAALKDGAKAILPLLEQYEETEPYALWLKARLDYFDVTEELRKKPAPKLEPGIPLPNPAPKIEREIWISKISQRPWPPEAKPYVAQLKPVFAGEKVPQQLVWIAEVESSFNPRARSPAGATGLFQLMPATAKQYGLRTWPFDQRVKPEPGARAAARHLRGLYDKFKDWQLAIAAYNAGEGTVQTLLKRYHARTYDSIATRLPAETQLYVPKVEATLLRREGIKLSQLPAAGA